MEESRAPALVAVYLILLKDHKTLLLRRCNTGWQDGRYSLISGHKQTIESPMEAIVREAKEEAGITLKPNNLKLVHTMFRKQTDERQRADLFFSANKWTGNLKNCEPSKCDDMNWFSLNRPPKNTADYIKHVLKNITKGIYYSEAGY